jgi:hypothetical protein
VTLKDVVATTESSVNLAEVAGTVLCSVAPDPDLTHLQQVTVAFFPGSLKDDWQPNSRQVW